MRPLLLSKYMKLFISNFPEMFSTKHLLPVDKTPGRIEHVDIIYLSFLKSRDRLKMNRYQDLNLNFEIRFKCSHNNLELKKNFLLNKRQFTVRFEYRKDKKRNWPVSRYLTLTPGQ